MTNEVQFAEVTIRVALKVSTDLSDHQRKRKIRNSIKEMNCPDKLEVFSCLPNSSDGVVLTDIETMKEAAERREAMAEREHMKKLERQREKYIDNNGHF